MDSLLANSEQTALDGLFLMGTQASSAHLGCLLHSDWLALLNVSTLVD